MFYIIFLFCLISVAKQTLDHCSTQPIYQKENTVTSDHCSVDAMENIEHTRNDDARNSNNFVTNIKSSTLTENNHEKSDSMALVLYNEESILPLHKSERHFEFVGHEIRIKQNWSGLGVAAVVWDAAVVLCKYLEETPTVVQDKTVVELGAGTGLVGLVSAFLGGKTTITDRQEVLDFLETSVDENTASEDKNLITVAALDWTKDLSDFGKFDVILGADIVYIEEIFDDLLRTLVHLSDKATVTLLSCRIRYDRDTNFLSKMEDDFVIEEIVYDLKTDVKVYKAKKR